MNVTIGSDHAAVDLKEEVKMVLHEFGDIQVKDVGTFDREAADYPDIAEKVCADVISGKADRGIVLCGTGVGISLAANKVPGIRAAVCSEPYTAKLTVEHNDANIIAMGARVVGSELAKMIVDSFFDAKFEGGRHAERVRMISDIEKKYCK